MLYNKVSDNASHGKKFCLKSSFNLSSTSLCLLQHKSVPSNIKAFLH